MLSKREKLSASEVRAILKEGRSARSAHMSVKFLPAASRKAAIVVSKKIAPSAVERNKIRRALFAQLRTSLPRRAHAVFMLQKKTDDYAPDLVALCSKLS